MHAFFLTYFEERFYTSNKDESKTLLFAVSLIHSLIAFFFAYISSVVKCAVTRGCFHGTASIVLVLLAVSLYKSSRQNILHGIAGQGHLFSIRDRLEKVIGSTLAMHKT